MKNLSHFLFVGLINLMLALPLYAQSDSISLPHGAKISPQQLDNFLLQQMQELQMPGLSFAVIQHQHIVYHRTLGITEAADGRTLKSSDLFDAASLTKTVFAYLILRMVDQGLIELDTPLYRYLPHPDLMHDKRHQLITARMVLSHSTGLPNWRFGKPLAFQFTPGTAVQYSGEAFEYLALVIANLKGVEKNELEKLFQQEVARPLGMKHSYTVWNDYLNTHRVSGHMAGKTAEGWGLSPSRPNFAAAFSLNTEAVDYAKFLIGLFSQQGLSITSFEQMLRIHSIDTKSDPVRRWGLGIEIKPSAQGMKYMHSGNNDNFSSHYVYLKEKGFGYVFFTNSEQAFVANKAIETFLTGDY
ncbi:serine hydrolase domain-containing protein [Rheinheimera pacifica]|uniref:serine hydrolase domain-containing protein n=1 Tax=Rheinheimera pacifica TaxID=173990 RepID=UPI002EDAD5A8